MPKTIAIVAPSGVPFQIGGAEKLWWGLRNALAESPDRFVELIKLPCREMTFPDLLDSYRMFYELDLSHFDMVISTKYPAWMVRHPNHVVYMQHTLRGLYDTYHFMSLPEMLEVVPRSLQELMVLVRKPEPDDDDIAKVFELGAKAYKSGSLPSHIFHFPGPLIREITHFFDRAALRPDKILAYLAISETVAKRKDYFPAGVEIKILPHPSDLETFHCGTGEYIFTCSRLNTTKRVRLIIDAMKYVKADIPLKIAGTGPELDYLKKCAAGDSRIEFLGHVADTDLPELYANALFVPFVPYNEDYGLITIEAMKSGKPVVTVSDAGGVCEFVQNGKTGLCVNPDVESLGRAMDELASNSGLCLEMGKNAQKLVAGITWSNTVTTLLMHAAQAPVKRIGISRRKILVCCPFAPLAHGAGGERRLYYFCRELAKKFDVLVVAFGKRTQNIVEVCQNSDNVYELLVPWPKDAIKDSEKLRSITGISSDDLALMNHCAEDEQLLEILAGQGADAACVIASHPFMYPAIQKTLSQLPLVYDAHNVETDMKEEFLKDAFPDILEKLKSVESSCCRAAKAVLACSKDNMNRFSELFNLDTNKIYYLPNGFDFSDIQFVTPEERRNLRRTLPFSAAKLALFIGSGHPPNSEAAMHIVQLAKRMPDVQFILAGSVSTQPGIRRMKIPQNMHLAGIVSEKVKNLLLQASDVGINPMTSGSGTNLKIIEYLGCGLESVSTPWGMRGMDSLKDKVHVCDLADFDKEMRNIFKHQASAEVLQTVSQETAQKFDWPNALAQLNPVIESII